MALTQRRSRRQRKALGVTLMFVAAVAIVISIRRTHAAESGLEHGSVLQRTVEGLQRLLGGIPQSGTTLGSPAAPVTVTYWGDLECPVCQQFTLAGGLPQLIARDVRAGAVKLVYRSACTATCSGPGLALFLTQQSAAYAAGRQHRFWYYAELFYREQGGEGSGYVSGRFLETLARQVPGLDVAQWNREVNAPALRAQVRAENALSASRAPAGTPTLTATGPRGSRTLPEAIPSYGQLEQAIRQVT